jgi:NADH-quinone oxidoreductase subunit D
MLRGAVCSWDLRKVAGYESYGGICFTVPQCIFVDCFDRYLLRVEEMRNSLFILKKCLQFTPPGSIKNDEKMSVKRAEMKTSMEGLIQHFKYLTTVNSVDSNGCYVGT